MNPQPNQLARNMKAVITIWLASSLCIIHDFSRSHNCLTWRSNPFDISLFSASNAVKAVSPKCCIFPRRTHSIKWDKKILQSHVQIKDLSCFCFRPQPWTSSNLKQVTLLILTQTGNPLNLKCNSYAVFWSFWRKTKSNFIFLMNSKKLIFHSWQITVRYTITWLF